jgi:hypothetical protein
LTVWRIASFGRVECYLTGRQRLEENPYRDRSESYVIVGLLAERHVGKVRLFINGENSRVCGRRAGIRCFGPHERLTAGGRRRLGAARSPEYQRGLRIHF